jgi:SAM-dependent methyltransferase
MTDSKDIILVEQSTDALSGLEQRLANRGIGQSLGRFGKSLVGRGDPSFNDVLLASLKELDAQLRETSVALRHTRDELSAVRTENSSARATLVAENEKLALELAASNARAQEFSALVTTRLSETNRTIELDVARITKQTDTLAAQLREEIGATAKEARSAAEKLDVHYKAEIDEVQGSIKTNAQSAADATIKSNAAQAKLAKDFDAKLKVLEQADRTTNEAIENQSAVQKTVNMSVDARALQNKSELEQGIAKTSGDLKTLVDAKFNDLGAQLTKSVEQLAQVDNRLQQDLEAGQARLTQTALATEAHLNGALEKLGAKQAHDILDSKKSTQELQTALADTDAKFTKTTAEIQQSINQIHSTLADRADAQSVKDADLRVELDAFIKALADNVANQTLTSQQVTELNDALGQANDRFEASVASANKIAEEASKEIARLAQGALETEKSTSELQTALADNVANQTLTSQQVTALGEALGQANDRFEASVASANKMAEDASKEIARLAQGALEAEKSTRELQTALADTDAKLTKATSEIQQSINAGHANLADRTDALSLKNDELRSNLEGLSKALVDSTASLQTRLEGQNEQALATLGTISALSQLASQNESQVSELTARDTDKAAKLTQSFEQIRTELGEALARVGVLESSSPTAADIEASAAVSAELTGMISRANTLEEQVSFVGQVAETTKTGLQDLSQRTAMFGVMETNVAYLLDESIKIKNALNGADVITSSFPIQIAGTNERIDYLLGEFGKMSMSLFEMRAALGVKLNEPVTGYSVVDRLQNVMLYNRAMQADLQVRAGQRAVPIQPVRTAAKPVDEIWVEFKKQAPLNFELFKEAFDVGAASYVGFPAGSCSLAGAPLAHEFARFVAPYLVNSRTTLDVGCGPQRIPIYLEIAHPDSIHGVDILAPYEPHSFPFVQTAGEFLPWEDDSFDVIVSGGALDHYYLLDVGMDEAWRVLKPGGYYVGNITLFDDAPPYDPYSAKMEAYDSEHLYHINMAWFEPFMRERGFELAELMVFHLPFIYGIMAFKKIDKPITQRLPAPSKKSKKTS